MLDVHPPHRAARTWADFFIHIATITIGLLIAIALEQGVEYLHHRHQVHDMEARLRQQSEDNLAVIAFDVSGCQTLLTSIDANLQALAGLRAGRAPRNWHRTPPPRPSFFAPEDAAWLMMRDSALLPLVPKSLAEDYWKIETTRDWLAGYGAEAGKSRIRLNAALALHEDAADLPIQDIDGLRAAYADYAANVGAYLYALTSYGQQIKAVLSGQPIDFRAVADKEAASSP